MQELFYRNIKESISSERLEAYCKDGADECTTLARYLWNIAVCESLYSPLQIAEIALRNAIHNSLSTHFGSTEWYERTPLREYESDQIAKAKCQIKKSKKAFISGDIVAELQFGFWTSLFGNTYKSSPIPAVILKHAIKNCYKSEKSIDAQKRRWDMIRELRNRVFHHERIIHWKDLKQQHEQLLGAIKWISDDLYELAIALDRFKSIYSDGIQPWKEKIRFHWPKT
jgi:hypothetical protein